jgi:hypothetical protein
VLITCERLDLQDVLDQFSRKLLFIHSLCLREKTVPNREYFISTNMAGRSSVNIRVISQLGVMNMIWCRVSSSSSSWSSWIEGPTGRQCWRSAFMWLRRADGIGYPHAVPVTERGLL